MKLNELNRLREEDEEPVLISMLRRILPAMRNGQLNYSADGGKTIATVTELAAGTSTDPDDLDLWVRSANRSIPPWRVTISAADVDKHTLRRTLVNGERHWLLVKKGGLTEEEERPLFVSMLSKLLSAHFKRGGPPVYLDDLEFGSEPMSIRGYAWRDDSLVLTVQGGAYGYRDITYPGAYVRDRHLRLKKNKDGDRWLATVYADEMHV